MASETRILDLALLGVPPGMPAVSPARGRCFAEAAGVCLDDQKHAQGIGLNVSGVDERRFYLRWPPATEQNRRTYRDMQDATRDGACAVALALVRELTDFTVIEQSWKTTGFDYWLGNESDSIFQNKARLEISGILSGDDAEIRHRIRSKKRQTERSDNTGLPACACVVEFSRPVAHFVQR